MSLNLAKNSFTSEYTAALQMLFQKTVNPKLSLDRMTELLKLINFDRASMRVVQVVGTNGKGSTVAFIESILQSNNVKTGLFTSPHLCSARERIRINGEMISEEDFAAAWHVVQEKSQLFKDEPSFFECISAMALWLFQKYHVDVAILEAGLGGRLDATTAVHADVLGISMIDLDHQHILGATIEEIACEKINAAHSGQVVVTVDQQSDAKKAIAKAQQEIGFTLKDAPLCHRPLGLFGDHQKANAGLALKLVEELGFKTSEEKNERGLLSVNWPGRFEIISDEQDVVFDGAHNPSGIIALLKCLSHHKKFAHRPLVLIYGSLSSQQAERKIELLMNGGLEIKKILLDQPKNPRAMTIDELKTLFLKHGAHDKDMAVFSAWPDAIKHAQRLSAAIVVCGSLYTVGALRGSFLSIPMDEKMPSF